MCHQVSRYLGSIEISSAVVYLSVALYYSNIFVWCHSASSSCENLHYYSIYCEVYRLLECGTDILVYIYLCCVVKSHLLLPKLKVIFFVIVYTYRRNLHLYIIDIIKTL